MALVCCNVYVLLEIFYHPILISLGEQSILYMDVDQKKLNFVTIALDSWNKQPYEASII